MHDQNNAILAFSIFTPEFFSPGFSGFLTDHVFFQKINCAGNLLIPGYVMTVKLINNSTI